MFSLCNPEKQQTTNKGKLPEPLKFKFLKSVNLLDILLKKFALPRKREPYSFKRHNLCFVDHENTSNVPVLHFPANNPKTSILFIYCHGAGSTLNNIYNLGALIRIKYGVGFIGYDYTGQGESERQFHSYQLDIKVILAFAVRQGYDLRRTVICGFSLGSYSALCIEGIMPRILVSPFSGIIPLIEDTEAQYEGELFDNIQLAEKIKARALLIHARNELIPLYHSRAIMDALLVRNDLDIIDMVQLQGYTHRNVPNFLVSSDGQSVLSQFLKQVYKQAKSKEFDGVTVKLLEELQKISRSFLIKKNVDVEGTKCN